MVTTKDNTMAVTLRCDLRHINETIDASKFNFYTLMEKLDNYENTKWKHRVQ